MLVVKGAAAETGKGRDISSRWPLDPCSTCLAFEAPHALGLRVDGFLVDAGHATERDHDQQGDDEPALVEADVDAEDTTKPDVDRQGSPLPLYGPAS